MWFADPIDCRVTIGVRRAGSRGAGLESGSVLLIDIVKGLHWDWVGRQVALLLVALGWVFCPLESVIQTRSTCGLSGAKCNDRSVGGSHCILSISGGKHWQIRGSPLPAGPMIGAVRLRAEEGAARLGDDP